MADEELHMSFWGHLEELRKRITWSLIWIAVGFAICFEYSEAILGILMRPMNTKIGFQSFFPFVTYTPKETNLKLYFATLTEPFMAHMKIAFVAGLMIVLPAVLYQVWKFIAPGLLQKERRYAGQFVFFSTVFFMVGVLFCYFLLLPIAIPFLMEFKTEHLVSIIKIGEYVDFSLKFLLGCGIVFELPLVLILLGRMGIVDVGWLVRFRKYAFLFSFILGAVITPTPDVFNMTLMSLPIYFLYEIGIFGVRFFGKKKTASTELTET